MPPKGVAVLRVRKPYDAFVAVARQIYSGALRPASMFGTVGVSPGAMVHPTAQLGEGVTVDPFAVIGPSAQIGAGSLIGAHAVIGPGVRIGSDCAIGANCTVTHSHLGDRVIIHPGCDIGQDGFGYLLSAEGHTKVPQVGSVVIHDDVEIGSGTRIDRGGIRDTVIGEGTKIDNLCQIGHNCIVGRHCIIVAQSGLSGSVTLEDFVVLGPRTGIIPHITVGKGAITASRSTIYENVPAGAILGRISGQAEKAMVARSGGPRTTRGAGPQALRRRSVRDRSPPPTRLRGERPNSDMQESASQIFSESFPWRAAKNRHCAAMTQQTEAKAKAGALIIPVTLFEQNCMLLWCEATKKAVVIDPGGDVDKIQAAIKQANVSVEKIWLTHGHIDHVGGAADLRDALKVEIIGPHIDDKFLTDNVVMSGLRFGMAGVRDFVPDRWLEEGDQVRIGELTFDILHCPGHSPGSVVFYNKEMRFAHVGDVLFSGSVGRTDLPGGDHGTLIKSITDKLLPLGDDVGFICGHGPGSSIGQERLTNPFLTGEM